MRTDAPRLLTLGEAQSFRMDQNGDRDRFVFDACLRARLPLAVSMAGGYAQDVEDIVDIHFATVVQAAEHARRWARHAAARGQ